VCDLNKKEKILIIDDDEDFLNPISTFLRERGYDVDVARTADEALKKTKKEYYSLMLIDIKLPDMDGLQLLERIDTSEPEIRKVIITGYPNMESAQQAFYLGAHMYFIKPFEVEALLEVIEKLLIEREKEFKDRYVTLK
jgi:DNA-binding NtrC family response regulator